MACRRLANRCLLARSSRASRVLTWARCVGALKQAGLGGTLSNTLKPYVIPAGSYQFAFTLAPLR